MTKDEINRRKLEVLKQIAFDMESDAKRFDGQPFNGKTVATYFGNHGAAIAALADIVSSLIALEAVKEVA